MKKLSENKSVVGLLLFGALIIGGLSLETNTRINNEAAVASLKSTSSKTSVVQNLFTTPKTGSALSSTWKKHRVGNVNYTEIPTASLQGVINFCKELQTKLPTNFITKANLTYEGVNDGKLYCISTGDMCGNGTPSGCQNAGCCGGCVGGIMPPGSSNPPTMNDFLQIPGLYFVPNTIINGINDAPNM